MKKGGRLFKIGFLLSSTFILAYSFIPRIEKINSLGQKEDLKVFVKRLNEVSTVLWSESLKDGYNGSIRHYSLKGKLVFPREILKKEISLQKCGINGFHSIFEKKIKNSKYNILCKDGNSMSVPEFKLICVEENK